MSLQRRGPFNVHHFNSDQIQFSEHLYNSLIMHKDTSHVNEKILNLTLEIIFLLTGEDYIVVKKQDDHVADSSSPCATDRFCRTQSPVMEASPNSLIQERDDDQKSLELTIKIRDESSERSTPERLPIHPYSQDYTEEDNRIMHDYQVEPEEMIFPQKCKEEEIPAEISADESSNRNTPDRRRIRPYSQNYIEEDNRITRDYQIEPGDVIFPRQCKEEENPTDISTGESSNRNAPERHPGNRITQDYQTEPGPVIFPQQCKEERIPTEISTEPQYILKNNSFAQNDEGSKLISGNSSSETLRNCHTLLDLDFALHEESNITACQIEQTGSEYFHSLINKHTEKKNKYQRLVSYEKMHRENKPFTCFYCGKSFPSSWQLNRHQRTHTGEKQFMYSEFGKCFTRSPNLVLHQKTHAGEKSFKCPVCGKSFSSPSNLAVHQRLHTGEKPFKCSECGKFFTKNTSLVAHQRIHTGEKPFNCSECGKSFSQSTSLVTHQRIHTGEKPFVCSECGKSFANTSNLVAHKRIHTGEKPFKCPVCGKAFISSSNLVAHHRIHTGEKPFKCSECGKSFTNTSNLVAHRKTHTGEKTFKCPVCGKSFISSSNLVAHRRIHTGEKPFKCSVCGKSFTHTSNLAAHHRTHTGEKTFNCSVCGKSFARSSNLVVHQRIHSLERGMSVENLLANFEVIANIRDCT
ncbi:uncharacterized protein WCC33_000583 isoform 1-T1 [Rhinophrynus dorsalis]